ncbi:MAG: hypothetical protein LBI12_00260, partial [Treponema sp.]|nr:hypothetical protein [Treponema sp.]
RLDNFSGNTADFKLIIQIGSLSGTDYVFTENPDISLVLEKLLYANDMESTQWDADYSRNPQIFSHEPRIASFTLTDDDRLKLGNANYLRVIAVIDGVQEVSGRVILAPPIVRSAAFRAITYDNGTVSGTTDFSTFNSVAAFETMDTGLVTLESAYGDLIKRLHPSGETQRVLKIEWKNMQNNISAGIDGRVGALPLSDYRELSFFIKGPDTPISGGTLSFFVASGPDSISDPQLEVRIPLSEFTAGKWSKVTIRYQGGNTGVRIDNRLAAAASFRYRPIQSFTWQDRRTSYVAVLVDPGAVPLPDTSICIDEIILEDSSLVYRMNAGGAVEYSKSGTLLYAGSIPVLSDFTVSAAMESEIRSYGSQDSGLSGSMVNRISSGVSVFGARVQGNLFTTAAKDTFLWSADHGISRTFGPFSVKETFFASPQERTARHGFNMALASSFYAGFDADAFYELSRLRQRWDLNMGYRSQFNFIPSVAVKTNALWVRNSVIQEDDSYAKLWLSSWEPLVPDDGSGAESRRTEAQAVITQSSTPVGAALTVDASTNFTGANSITRLENSTVLDVPVTFDRFSFSLKAGRGFKRHLNYSGNNIFDDTGKFGESINDSLELWKVFPFYSLFSPKLNEAMDEALNNSPSFNLAQYSAFNDHFSTSVNFPRVYSLVSFAVPYRVTVALERVLEQKMDIRTDIFNLGGALNFSSINMFGVMGYRPVFDFYQTDEFAHTLEGAAIFSAGDVSWRLRSVFGAGFRGFSGETLSFVNTLTLRSDSYWMDSFVLNWTVPTENSLLSIFYNWVTKAATNHISWLNLSGIFASDYEQLRIESMELTLDKTRDKLRWSLTLGHESIVRIVGRLNFTTFVKLRLSEDQASEVFTFDTLLGTTLRVSF